MADMQKAEIPDRVLETGKLRDEVKDDDGTAKHLPPVDHPPDVRREIFRRYRLFRHRIKFEFVLIL